VKYGKVSLSETVTDKDPQPIQKIYPIIDFSEGSYSKGENNVTLSPISKIWPFICLINVFSVYIIEL